MYSFYHKIRKFIIKLEGKIVSRYVFKNLGVKVKFNGYGTFKFNNPESVILGKNIHIGRGFFIRAEGGLYIGENTHISRNLMLYTHNHNYEGTRLPYDNSFIFKPVKIGKNVWVGTNVIILPGSTIGDGCIVGAGSVVSGNFEDLCIIGGNPARKINYRDESHYSSLENKKLYGGVNGK